MTEHQMNLKEACDGTERKIWEMLKRAVHIRNEIQRLGRDDQLPAAMEEVDRLTLMFHQWCIDRKVIEAGQPDNVVSFPSCPDDVKRLAHAHRVKMGGAP